MTQSLQSFAGYYSKSHFKIVLDNLSWLLASFTWFLGSMLSNIISLKTGSDLLLTKKLIFISQVTRLMPALKLMWPFITGSH